MTFKVDPVESEQKQIIAERQREVRQNTETRVGVAQDAGTSVDPNEVAKAVDSNKAVVFGSRSIEFNFDRDANRVIVKVRDLDTEEIVRQIPPEDYLSFVDRFEEAVGLLFDEVA